MADAAGADRRLVCWRCAWLAGGIVAAVGLCLLLIDQLDWRIPLDKIAVPMILIAVGLSVVFGRRKCA
ncbi:MAG: hypothetical protein ACLR76_01595 [Alistipes sp.]